MNDVSSAADADEYNSTSLFDVCPLRSPTISPHEAATQARPSPQPGTQPRPSPQVGTQPRPSPQPGTQPRPSPNEGTQPRPRSWLPAPTLSSQHGAFSAVVTYVDDSAVLHLQPVEAGALLDM